MMKMIDLNKRPDPETGIGLYVHVPFCVRKCAYCDFLSFPACEKEREDYVEALCREIRSHGGQTLRTIYFGGGTPSILSLEQMEKICRTIRHAFTLQEDLEWTIECNPATFDLDKAKGWRALGFNRVSMGVQSLDDRLLRRIGRIHTADEAREGFRTLRKAGFSNISVDLMMGLPEQSMEDWLRSLKEVISWQPEHMSCYSLILEEGTPLYEEEDLPLPDEDTERAMYHETVRMLKEAGLPQYEISNFAKPGLESRHNTSYWQRIPYLGMGLGASSLWEEKRYINVSGMKEYMEGEPWILQEELSEEDQMKEFMMLGLRMIKGVSLESFFRTFGIQAESVFHKELNTLREAGLIELSEGSVHLTAKGLDLANQVFMEFV